MNTLIANTANKKVFEFDYPELPQLLSEIPGKNTFLLDRWQFINGTVADFGVLRSLISVDREWIDSFDFDPVEAVKAIFVLSLRESHSASSIKNRYDVLSKTLIYLQRHGLTAITHDLLPDYLEYLLMHGQVLGGGPSPRLTPVSCGTLSDGFKIDDIVYAITELNIEFMFDKTLRSKKVKKEIANAIQIISGGDLTYGDWVAGKSFNNLTLDYGQFYVEHCSNFFNQNWALACGIQKTKSETYLIIDEIGARAKKKNLYGGAITQILSGFDISETEPYKTNVGGFLKPLIDVTNRRVSENIGVYKAFFTINSPHIAGRLGEQVANYPVDIEEHRVCLQEFLQAFVAVKLEPEHFTNALEVYSLRLKLAENMLGADFDIEELKLQTAKEWRQKKEACRADPPSQYEYARLGIKLSDFSNANRDRETHRLTRSCQDAGITLLVALTGWRESEFGFSPEDISISRNPDILDNDKNPMTYKVFWYVKKTNRFTKVYRDLTRSCADLVCQLFVLSDDAENQGVKIYSSNNQSDDQSKSNARIVNAVPGMWNHFVWNYEPFLNIDQLQELRTLQKKSILASDEAKRLQELDNCWSVENWERLESDPLLMNAYTRARSEVDRLHLVKDLRSTYRPRNIVWALKARNLPDWVMNILDKHVSDETRAYVCDLGSEFEVTKHLSDCVTNEILADCLYPTPHAFRHMWAESVYRRFDGDVGWMIRSNFKHISQSMWLAYIRNKDNQTFNQQVKRKVVSSLLTNYLNNSGNGYAGAMEKLVRRLFLKTSVHVLEDIDDAIADFANIEIEDIKSNPWGFCMLKRRNKHLAKCAVNGEPQRQNAAPRLCLGCSNFFAQSGNVPGIILGISNDLNGLVNVSVPETFKKESRETVEKALAHLKKLDADPEILDEIESILRQSKTSEAA